MAVLSLQQDGAQESSNAQQTNRMSNGISHHYTTTRTICRRKLGVRRPFLQAFFVLLQCAVYCQLPTTCMPG